jgi:hypothetical protein
VSVGGRDVRVINGCAVSARIAPIDNGAADDASSAGVPQALSVIKISRLNTNFLMRAIILHSDLAGFANLL